MIFSGVIDVAKARLMFNPRRCDRTAIGHKAYPIMVLVCDTAVESSRAPSASEHSSLLDFAKATCTQLFCGESIPAEGACIIVAYRESVLQKTLN